ncbi:hypothetical protein [Clostridium hydrogeniformans]|uniref:hypothetical protein n=1 Tax=Clostridium hydrogeniformans TaxID=349933 RepID=UPI00048212CF|nr:hypothetical protein [Clostridium hydrogeniformans]
MLGKLVEAQTCGLKIREEFKNLIPPLMEEEKTELEKSILMFGCRDKVITWNGIIIDGHNRYEICTRNKIKFEILNMDYDFENEEEVEQWIIKNQFARRNISSYQRSILALQLKESIAKKAKENQGIRSDLTSSRNLPYVDDLSNELAEFQNNNELVNDKSVLIKQKNDEKRLIEKPINTREEIAKIAGVSHDTIHKVETIEKEAPKVIKEAAKENIISVNKAYKITKEVKALKEEEKENKAEELLNQQYTEKARKVDKEKKIADKIADIIYGVLTIEIDEKRIGYYLEYSPAEPLEKHIQRCDESIKKLENMKSIFENMKKIKVVK